MRPISATIDLAALRHNLGVARRHAPQAKVMAVVKANGYGHGLLRAAQGLAAADGFAVLNIEEALALREAGYQQSILLLEGAFSVAELMLAAEQRLIPVVHCAEQLAMLETARLPLPISVFLKINTGMNRLGFPAQGFADALRRLQQLPGVDSITLMTHFATADEAIGVQAPYASFRQLTARLDMPKSLANSAATLLYPATHHDWVRPGIMLYGASPIAGTPAKSLDLRPVMQLHSEIITVQILQAGDGLGYGQRFTAQHPTRIGVVACGYADGYPRHAGVECKAGETPIAVGGRMTRTLGRVSMDMLFVDLTEIPEAGVGSPVELWGAQVPVDAVAESCGTVGYELLCALAQRVPVRLIG